MLATEQFEKSEAMTRYLQYLSRRFNFVRIGVSRLSPKFCPRLTPHITLANIRAHHNNVGIR
jgi:hypothetical protein